MNNNYASMENMMKVANNCEGYESEGESFVSEVGSEESKSCLNCKNLVNNKCQKNLYDMVLSGVDEC